MGRRLVTITLFVLSIIQLFLPCMPATAATVSFEQQVVNLVNQERANRGLPPLVVHYLLESAAQDHSADMGDHGVCQHDSTDGTSWSTRIRQHGYTPTYGLAENVACGYATPEQVVSAWMASPGHRENILGNYAHVGVGYYNIGTTGYRHYWTMDLGRPAPDTPPPQPLPTPTPCALEYDFSNNGMIDADDIEILAQHWQAGEPYNPTFDLNRDQIIDVIDVMIVSSEWGMTCQ